MGVRREGQDNEDQGRAGGLAGSRRALTGRRNFSFCEEQVALVVSRMVLAAAPLRPQVVRLQRSAGQGSVVQCRHARSREQKKKENKKKRTGEGVDN